jgi:molybdopterin/thiamine biosynthesis adenylyltransferase
LIRQWDLIPIETLGQRIHVIGCGAIGSFTALGLAKMGFTNMVVWDFDEVSIENMSNQWFRHKDIGRPKNEALRDLIEDFTGERIEIAGEFTGQKLDGYVVTAVDNMRIRKLVYESNRNNPIKIIDPRMSSEYATLHVFDGGEPGYAKTLFDDANGVQERCTAKSTMYTAMMISGLVCKTVKDLVNQVSHPRIVDWNILENSFVCYTKQVNNSVDQGGQVGSESVG